MPTAESISTTKVSHATPKVSVIIPTYKTAHFIAACLDSVFAQTYQEFEAVVVNDGSPDTPELERVLAPYLDRIFYIKQENKRTAGARNNAIRHAHGEYVAFLDSDDVWMPDHLASQMKMFADDPSLGLTYSNGLVGEPDNKREFMLNCPSAGEATFESLLVERCQIPISTVVARKEAIVRAGMFDEKLARCDDYDMWVRTAFYGAKIAYTRKVQAYMPVGRPGSLSQSRARLVEGYWAILEKYKQTLPLKDAQRAMVEKRAADIRARFLVEEAKSKLGERQFGEARKLFTEANTYLHKASLSAVVFGLKIAPGTTAKLISFFNRMRHGAAA